MPVPPHASDVLQCLRAALPASTADGHSTVLDPSHHEWTHASEPYNIRLAEDTWPIGIVYPSTPAHISSTVACGATHHVPVVARSGGHSYGAFSLGGAVRNTTLERSLVIDMHAFSTLEYDAVADIVTVGSGVLLGDMNNFLELHGRMLPTGSCPTVGVGGQVLAGGFGGFSRSAGLFLDHLVEMDVVMASGKRETISDAAFADLFWAMRGAGSSMAIAHTFRLHTQPAPQAVIYFELTLLPRALPPTTESAERSAGLYHVFERFGESDDAVPDLGMLSWHVTPEPAGEGRWGTKVEVLGQYIGNAEEFQIVMSALERRLKDRGEVNYHMRSTGLSFRQSMHSVGGNWTRLEDRGPLNINEHVNFYAKSLLTKQSLASDRVQTHLAHLLSLSPQHNPATDVDWFVLSPFLGGPQSAVTKRSTHHTAFAHRDLRVVWELYAKVPEGTKGSVDLVDFVQGMTHDLLPVDGVYPAYVDPLLGSREFPGLVYGSNYRRLQEVKAKYDPDNLFRYAQSVKPVRSLSSSWVASAVLLTLLCAGAWYRRLHRRSKGMARRSRLD